jgi:hypothetical protein
MQCKVLGCYNESSLNIYPNKNGKREIIAILIPKKTCLIFLPIFGMSRYGKTEVSLMVISDNISHSLTAGSSKFTLRFFSTRNGNS